MLNKKRIPFGLIDTNSNNKAKTIGKYRFLKKTIKKDKIKETSTNNISVKI